MQQVQPSVTMTCTQMLAIGLMNVASQTYVTVLRLAPTHSTLGFPGDYPMLETPIPPEGSTVVQRRWTGMQAWALGNQAVGRRKLRSLADIEPHARRDEWLGRKCTALGSLPSQA